MESEKHRETHQPPALRPSGNVKMPKKEDLSPVPPNEKGAYIGLSN